MFQILRKGSRQKSHALYSPFILSSFQQSVLRELSCFQNWCDRNSRQLGKKCLQIHNVGCICDCPWRLCHHVLHGRLHCSHRVCLHQLSRHVHQVRSAQESHYCQCWKEKQLLANQNWCSILKYIYESLPAASPLFLLVLKKGRELQLKIHFRSSKGKLDISRSYI